MTDRRLASLRAVKPFGLEVLARVIAAAIIYRA
jgi:hypothetical protein